MCLLCLITLVKLEHSVRKAKAELLFFERTLFLTICGSFDRLTQPEISFSVSRFTVLILRIKGCFVTISPATQWQKKHTY